MTDAYGAGILADAGVLSKPVRLCRASDPSDLSDPSDKTAHSAGACTPAGMLTGGGLSMATHRGL